MKNGTVKFFNETKGFGFIKLHDSDQEFFVHVSGLKEEIRQNDEVVFEVRVRATESFNTNVFSQTDQDGNSATTADIKDSWVYIRLRDTSVAPPFSLT